MGLIEKLFPKASEQYKAVMQASTFFQTLTAYQPVFSSWRGQIYESELVRSSIDARARHISKLKVEAPDNASSLLKKTIDGQPNRYQTWNQFLYRVSTILDVNNTAFIFPVFNQYMEFTGYYTSNVVNWSLIQDEKERPWLQVEFFNGQKTVYLLNEVGILTKYQYSLDFFGESNSALDDTMTLIDIQNKGIKEAIRNSSAYRFMASVNNFTKAEDLAKERKRFSSENFGQDNSNGLLLFPSNYSNITQIKSSQYLIDPEQLKLIRTNVYNYFGVNEDILQNKAFGDELNAFYEGAIAPFMIQLSEVLTKMTFSDKRDVGKKIVITSNRMQYLSNKDKLTVSTQMADRGVMTINEIRALWGLEPVAGGDTRTIRGEYYQLDEEGNIITKDSEVKDE